jgi:hypothetical protein
MYGGSPAHSAHRPSSVTLIKRWQSGRNKAFPAFVVSNDMLKTTPFQLTTLYNPMICVQGTHIK